MKKVVNRIKELSATHISDPITLGLASIIPTLATVVGLRVIIQPSVLYRIFGVGFRSKDNERHTEVNKMTKYKVDGKIDGQWYSNDEPIFDTREEAKAHGEEMVEIGSISSYRLVKVEVEVEEAGSRESQVTDSNA